MSRGWPKHWKYPLLAFGGRLKKNLCTFADAASMEKGRGGGGKGRDREGELDHGPLIDDACTSVLCSTI